MALETVTAWVMLGALGAYALFGGADFGAGVWDLLASGPRKQEQKDALARAIGPIWEANHVWLVLLVVLMFSGFPSAFAAMSTALHVPLTIVLVGIVLRGSAFVFRQYGPSGPAARRWGRTFAIASIVTPVFLGVSLGTMASGRLHWEDGVYVSGFFAPWLAPFPWAVGCFTLSIFAFLAAVYLCAELEDGPLRDDFRRRALRAAIAVGATAAVTWALAEHIGDRLRAWPLQLATAVAATGAILALWSRRFVLARTLAVAQVALIVFGYGWALFPHLIVPEFTVENTAASQRTHELLLGAVTLGAVVLLPSLAYLMRVFKGRRAFELTDP
jgi:cytochrome bd ubiquinol oxidase subunit II